jgi:hypothetical protein
VVIIDIARTGEYEAGLRAAGLDVERSGRSFAVYPPVRTVRATKVATDDERPTP